MDSQNNGFAVEEPSLLLEPKNDGSASLLKHEETAEERIQEEIKRFNLADAKIAEMAAKYKDLKIRPLPASEDKAEMKLYREEKEAVREGLAIVRKVRTGLETKRKELKADYLKIGTGIDEEAKRLAKLVVPIEEPLKESFDAAEAAEESRKNEAARLEQEKLQGRVADLIEAGIKFDGSFYSIGDISVDVVTLKTLPNEAYSNLMSKVKEAKSKVDAEALEEARKIQEAKDKEAEERQKFREEQEAFKKQQEELQRQKDELALEQEKARKQLIANRRAAVEGLGLMWNSLFQKYSVANASGIVDVTLTEVTESSEEKWAEIFSSVAGLVKDLQAKEEIRIREAKLKEEEDQKRAMLQEARIHLLWKQGFVIHAKEQTVSFGKDWHVHPLIIPFVTIGAVDEEGWAAMFDNWISTAKEIQADLDAAALEQKNRDEEARQLKMSEAERAAEYFAKLGAIPKPEVTTPGFSEVFNTFCDAMETASVFFDIVE